MCECEKQKLLEHGQALTDDQKAVIIQKFGMGIILNEIARRNAEFEELQDGGKKLFGVWL